MNDSLTTPDMSLATYTTLSEISRRRRQLQQELHSETKHMTRLRRRLFKSDAPAKRRGRRFSLPAMLSAGTGVLDGALLAWKLYRRFKK